MKQCPDEIVLQAYCDGELSPTKSRDAAAHLSACAECCATVQEINDETALLTAAFAAAWDAPVPSEKLRARLDLAIAEENTQPAAAALAPGPKWWTRRAAQLSGLLGALLMPRGLAWASLLLAAVAGLSWYAGAGRGTPGTLSAALPANRISGTAVAGVVPAPVAATTPAPRPVRSAETSPVVVAARYRGTPPAVVRELPVKPQQSRAVAAPVSPIALAHAAPLPGEKSYLKALESLDKTIAQDNGEALPPSLRATYERNIALLNQAIRASQKKARRNPQDDAAAGFLYSSYQSKLELMTTVAQQVRPLGADR